MLADHIGNCALLAATPNRAKGASTIIDAMLAVHDVQSVSTFKARWLLTPRNLELGARSVGDFKRMTSWRADTIRQQQLLDGARLST